MSKFYIMDVKRLDPQDHLRLAQHIARKWRMMLGEVLEELDQNGLPILADHCTVTIKNPQRWI